MAADSLLVVATDVTQAPNDNQQLEPMLTKLSELPDDLGKVETPLAGNGYVSKANVKACEAWNLKRLFVLRSARRRKGGLS